MIPTIIIAIIIEIVKSVVVVGVVVVIIIVIILLLLLESLFARFWVEKREDARGRERKVRRIGFINSY